ncbi:hypothetical protein RND71_036599 [Anisodus tanguticus]|uniref:Uncharacterized protein n=1 Tax=Anisodus tanguticus TaxID=243964 RepID=A0AAE1R1B5_9SOLA|nr:hypothetical protein RND71_036599 [Anisodus tanguticus]
MAVGSGWQAVVAYVNLATYYFIGLPIGCILGFKTSLQAAVEKAVDRLKEAGNRESEDLADSP